MIEVNSPAELFADTDGEPLDDGYIYIGESGQNPETNPQTVYWDKDGLIPAVQPIRTRNGFPYRDGAASKFYTEDAFYSITVRNKKRELVISTLNTDSGVFDELANATGAASVGYDNAVSGLAATDVQDAIDELETEIDALEATIGDALAQNSGIVNIFGNSAFNINTLGYVSGTPTTGANQTTLDLLKVVVSGENLTFTAGTYGNAITAPSGGLEQAIAASLITGGDYACTWVGAGTITVNGVARAKNETFTLPAQTAATIRLAGSFERFMFTRPSMLGSFEYDLERDLAICQPGHDRWQTAAPVTLAGTATDLTGIPAWANEAEAVIIGMSTTSTSVPLFQLNGETTGYVGVSGEAGALIAWSTGISVRSIVAAASITGVLRLTRQTGNTWAASYEMSDPTPLLYHAAGRVILPSALASIRFTTALGTPTFDAGTATLRWRA